MFYYMVDDGHDFCGHKHKTLETAEHCRLKLLRQFWRAGSRHLDDEGRKNYDETMQKYVDAELNRIAGSQDGSDIQLVEFDGDKRLYHRTSNIWG